MFAVSKLQLINAFTDLCRYFSVKIANLKPLVRTARIFGEKNKLSFFLASFATGSQTIARASKYAISPTISWLFDYTGEHELDFCSRYGRDIIKRSSTFCDLTDIQRIVTSKQLKVDVMDQTSIMYVVAWSAISHTIVFVGLRSVLNLLDV